MITGRPARLARLVLVMLLTSACSKRTTDQQPDGDADPDETIEITDEARLSFRSLEESTGIGGTTGGQLFGLCDLLGPQNGLVIAELTEFPTYHPDPPPEDCDEKAYQRSYYTVPSAVLTSVGPGPTNSELNFVVFHDDAYVQFSDDRPDHAEVGDVILASVRESRGTWFIDDWMYVSADMNNDTVGAFPADSETPVDIPDTWGDLTREATDVQSDYSSACPDRARPREPMYLDDTAYEDYAYPPPYDCDGVQLNTDDEGPAESTSDTNNG